MAAKAKASTGPGRKRGAGKTVKEQLNGIDPEALREFFDSVHGELDEMEEANATTRGAINRIYDKACDKLDVSKDALSFLFKKERRQRKAAAKAAKMDTRARDSLLKLSQALGDSPMGQWADEMAKRAGTATEE
jgi:hypothetical protein